MDPVFFIDSYAQIFRGFYAVRALTNQKGEPTNAIFAMMRFLIKLETDHPPRDSQESSPKPRFKSINPLALSFPYGPTVTSIHDYWKIHSFD